MQEPKLFPITRQMMISIAALVMIFFAVALTWGLAQQSIALKQEILQVESFERASNVLFIDLLDAETGQRGYLLTGDDQYLDIYYSAVRSAPLAMARLFEVAKFPSQNTFVNTLNPLVQRKLNLLADSIQTHRQRGHEAAMEIVFTGEGKRSMDMIRELMRKQTSYRASWFGRAREMLDFYNNVTICMAFISVMLIAQFFAIALRPKG